MKGIVVFYMNYSPLDGQDPQQLVDLLMRCNQVVIDKIINETGYQVMVVPTTNEACRIEKIDFDKPYPRFLPRTHGDIGEHDRRLAEKKEKIRMEAEKRKLREENK